MVQFCTVQDLTPHLLLLNTSFNVSEEPIVCTPSDAYRCFMACDLDYLVIGSYLLDKQTQPKTITEKHEDSGERHYTIEDIRQSRIFGLLFGALALIGSIPLHLKTHQASWATTLIGIFLIFLGGVYPKQLAPLSRSWMRFGTAVSKIVTTCLLILFYFLALCPCALAARLSGKQFIEIESDKELPSYWQQSVSPEDEQASGQKQF